MKRESWSAEQETEWQAWVATLAPEVQAVALRFPPHTLFIWTFTGHVVYPYSYVRVDGKVKVRINIERAHNPSLDEIDRSNRANPLLVGKDRSALADPDELAEVA